MNQGNDADALRVYVLFVTGQPESLEVLGALGNKWLNQLSELVVKIGSSKLNGEPDKEALGAFSGIFGCLTDMFVITVTSPFPGVGPIVYDNEHTHRAWLGYIAKVTGVPEETHDALIARLVDPAPSSLAVARAFRAGKYCSSAIHNEYR